jgi:hypothetical protein
VTKTGRKNKMTDSKAPQFDRSFEPFTVNDAVVWNPATARGLIQVYRPPNPSYLIQKVFNKEGRQWLALRDIAYHNGELLNDEENFFDSKLFKRYIAPKKTEPGFRKDY